MAQFLRPNADLENSAYASAFPSGTTLYTLIDEVSASDDDYFYRTIYQANVVRIGLSAAGDPQTSTNHILRVRLRAFPVETYYDEDGGYYSYGYTYPSGGVKLYQGNTLIATLAPSSGANGVFTTFSHTLTSAEADAITDYSALELRFPVTEYLQMFNGTYQGGYAVSWAELEVPNAAPPKSGFFAFF